MIKRPTTLKGYIAWGLVQTFVTTGAFALALSTNPDTSAQVIDTPYTEAQESRVDRLFREAHCWTGDQAPKTKDPMGPAHALVTRNNKTKVVDASIGYAIWLEGAPGTLHGFCR